MECMSQADKAMDHWYKKAKGYEKELTEIADLLLTTSYTEEGGNRIFCGNESIWLDAVAERLRKYKTKRTER
jgi:hypothetical protein